MNFSPFPHLLIRKNISKMTLGHSKGAKGVGSFKASLFILFSADKINTGITTLAFFIYDEQSGRDGLRPS